MLRYVAAFIFFAAMICAGILFSLTERELYRTTSAVNGVVRVTENFRGVRFLRFGDSDAVQSAVRIKDPAQIVTPYVRVALAAFSFVDRKPLNVLVIGMGAGSMSNFARRFAGAAVVDSVDIDSSVIDLAGRYFGFQADQLGRAHAVDGRQFVESVTAPYDVIFLDAFNGTEAPAHLLTLEFFQAVRRALAPGGVVASNVLYRDKSPLYDSIVATMNAALGPGVVSEVPGGSHQRILFHFQQWDKPPVNLAQRAEQFAAARGFRPGVGVVSNLAPAQPLAAEVFRDRLSLQTAEGVRR